MSDYLQWITHQGHTILLVQCAHKLEQEIVAAMEEATQEILKQPPGKRMLILMDMSHTAPSSAVNAKGREMVARAKAKGIPEQPTAMVGFTGVQKAIAQMFTAIRRDNLLHLADSLDEAKAWLVQHKGK